MPSKFIEKDYAEDTFYHVFNRGVEKRNIFLDDADYQFFLSLFERYLSPKVSTKDYKKVPNFSASMDLLAYCLMPNHFHLLIYQKDSDVMQKFMSSLSTSYSMYFNKKYKRVGKLFQNRYKAVRVSENSYFTHISRYIHLNPLDISKNYLTYEYSSLKSWTGDSSDKPQWLKPDRAREEFTGPKDYLIFLAEYESVKYEIDQIKKSLKE